jgi:hypothetical protein
MSTKRFPAPDKPFDRWTEKQQTLFFATNRVGAKGMSTINPETKNISDFAVGTIGGRTIGIGGVWKYLTLAAARDAARQVKNMMISKARMKGWLK